MIVNLMDHFLISRSTLAPSALGTGFHTFLSTPSQEDTIQPVLSFQPLSIFLSWIRMHSEFLEQQLTNGSSPAGST